MIHRWLFTQIDNSALIIFRIFFGFLIAAEAFGAICTGWVHDTLVNPKFTFNFIGLDFLQPLPGYGMYFYFSVLGCAGIMIMLGYKYRYSMATYTLLWAGVYFMQKSSYNNHYYLLLLLCVMMCFLPAAGYFSIDAKNNPLLKKIKMPRWCSLLIISQLTIVYTYAAIAKMYPDWLDHTVAKNLMGSKINYPIVGEFLQLEWVYKSITYVGILFDLLIIPLLLNKRTRTIAFGISIFFHLFNSIIFQIGIFPYMSLAFTLFFFSKERIHHIFLKNKTFYNAHEIIIPKHANFMISAIGIWLCIQLTLPIRHWFIPGDVLWTEEGHRLSWRMMLRGRTGITYFYVVDKNDPTAQRKLVLKSSHLTPKQIRLVSTRPDGIWQFCKYIKKQYALDNKDVAVYVNSSVSVNGKKYKQFIDPEVDIANEDWNHFKTNPWVLKHNKTTN